MWRKLYKVTVVQDGSARKEVPFRTEAADVGQASLRTPLPTGSGFSEPSKGE